MKCPTCGREMVLEEKDTSSGRDMRTYHCPSCKKSVDVDNGRRRCPMRLQDEKVGELNHAN
jgi:transposase-like protein